MGWHILLILIVHYLTIYSIGREVIIRQGGGREKEENKEEMRT